MFTETFLLRMTDTMISQNIDLSSWDTCIIKKKDKGKAAPFRPEVAQRVQGSYGSQIT